MKRQKNRKERRMETEVNKSRSRKKEPIKIMETLRMKEKGRNPDLEQLKPQLNVASSQADCTGISRHTL